MSEENLHKARGWLSNPVLQKNIYLEMPRTPEVGKSKLTNDTRPLPSDEQVAGVIALCDSAFATLHPNASGNTEGRKS